MTTIDTRQWSTMSEAEQARLLREAERPYRAANGHVMVQYPRWIPDGDDARPIYSSAWTTCVDNCPASANGEELPDW